MRVTTRLALLIIALMLGAPPGNSQETKTKPSASIDVQAPPPPAVEYNPNSWKEFSDERGMFTIMFPGIPIDSDNASGELTGRKFTLKTSAFYLLAYQDFPATTPADLEKDATLRKQFFDGMRDLILSRSKAKVLNESEIAVDNHPGRLTKFALPEGMIVREKDLVVGKRVYQILVITPGELSAPDGGQFDETRATKFLDSFKLARAQKN
jgi:hypothetical protein